MDPDVLASRAIFDLAHAKYVGSAFDALVTYGGLIPYELYVLPGMAVAILYAMLKKHPSSLRFHVLPHVFAFSLVGLIKMMVRRPRPGCYGPDRMVRRFEQNYVDGTYSPSKGKCKVDGPPKKWANRKGFAYVSFPSGHAMVAWAVMTGLVLHLMDSNEPKWTRDESKRIFALIGAVSIVASSMLAIGSSMRRTIKPDLGLSIIAFAVLAAVCFTISYTTGVDFDSMTVKLALALTGMTVAILVALHRIAKGYHHLFDSIVGLFLGFCVGLTVYTSWPSPTDFTPTVDKVVRTMRDPARYTIGAIAAVYIAYFFLVETKCVDASGCSLKALAKTEH